MTDLPPSARKVQDLLASLGYDNRVVTFPAGTRTAADAARAIGCDVAQIAKSLVFRTEPSGRPVLVITSGANRVNESRLGNALSDRLGGEGLGRADAAFVREATGFAIGGVPPLGHASPAIVIVDRALLDHDEIWAAAGTPDSVFPLTPAQLVAMTGGTVTDVT